MKTVMLTMQTFFCATTVIFLSIWLSLWTLFAVACAALFLSWLWKSLSDFRLSRMDEAQLHRRRGRNRSKVLFIQTELDQPEPPRWDGDSWSRRNAYERELQRLEDEDQLIEKHLQSLAYFSDSSL